MGLVCSPALPTLPIPSFPLPASPLGSAQTPGPLLLLLYGKGQGVGQTAVPGATGNLYSGTCQQVTPCPSSQGLPRPCGPRLTQMGKLKPRKGQGSRMRLKSDLIPQFPNQCFFLHQPLTQPQQGPSTRAHHHQGQGGGEFGNENLGGPMTAEGPRSAGDRPGQDHPVQ